MFVCMRKCLGILITPCLQRARLDKLYIEQGGCYFYFSLQEHNPCHHLDHHTAAWNAIVGIREMKNAKREHSQRWTPKQHWPVLDAREVYGRGGRVAHETGGIMMSEWPEPTVVCCRGGGGKVCMNLCRRVQPSEIIFSTVKAVYAFHAALTASL